MLASVALRLSPLRASFRFEAYLSDDPRKLTEIGAQVLLVLLRCGGRGREERATIGRRLGDENSARAGRCTLLMGPPAVVGCVRVLLVAALCAAAL